MSEEAEELSCDPSIDDPKEITSITNVEALDDTTFQLTTTDQGGPSGVLLVDAAGNILGDLGMTLDANQMPIFITHITKAADCNKESNNSIIELSEVNQGRKRKLEEDEDTPFELKSWLTNFQEKVSNRLKSLEEKASALDVHCQFLKNRTQNLSNQVHKFAKLNTAYAFGKGRNGTIIVGVPPSGTSDEDAFPLISNVYGSASALQLITHNTEADHPDGSWLGNPDNPELRVRCPLPEKDLENLTKACTSGEKMALTLLDYLFDRETQACSNISGNSKHGKKQLDPLKIYGIKCHVMHHFAVDDQSWTRIKLNLDSKCRTAFRRKLKGMPLTVKAFKDSRESISPTFGENGEVGKEVRLEIKEEEMETIARLPSLVEEEAVPNGKIARLTTSHRTYSKYQPRLLPKPGLEEEEEADETAAVLSLMEVEGDEDNMGEDSIPVTIHHGGTALSLPLSQLYGEPQVLFASQASQLIQTDQGDFQLLQATPEQLAQIQQGLPIPIQFVASHNVLSSASEMTEQGKDPC